MLCQLYYADNVSKNGAMYLYEYFSPLVKIIGTRHTRRRTAHQVLPDTEYLCSAAVNVKYRIALIFAEIWFTAVCFVVKAGAFTAICSVAITIGLASVVFQIKSGQTGLKKAALTALHNSKYAVFMIALCVAVAFTVQNGGLIYESYLPTERPAHSGEATPIFADAHTGTIPDDYDPDLKFTPAEIENLAAEIEEEFSGKIKYTYETDDTIYNGEKNERYKELRIGVRSVKNGDTFIYVYRKYLAGTTGYVKGQIVFYMGYLADTAEAQRMFGEE